MQNTALKEDIYEVEFEQLKNNNSIEAIDSKKSILNAKLNVEVLIGSCKKNIKEILNLKDGDIITLDKSVDKDLDININNENVASGEIDIVDNKVAIRISKLGK